MGKSNRIGSMDWPDYDTLRLLAEARDEFSRLYMTAIRKLARIAGTDPEDVEAMKALHTIIRREARTTYAAYDAEQVKKTGAIRPPRTYGDNQP